jgi:glycosyltransferase involved in cell wall biosynthesis
MNQANPLITIITVTYNSANYVRDAIEGVLAQTYKNIEYIIADDCSTDETWTIISEYNDKRIVAYRNEKNLREYPNRNKAINLAKGEYLIFLDGDDVMFPNAIEVYLKHALAFPKAAIIIQRSYYNNILFPLQLNSIELITNKYLSKFDLMSSSLASNFFKTKILKEVGLFDVTLKASDEEIRTKIACNHSVVFINGWLTWPRETPGQAASKITTVDSAVETKKFIEKLYNSKVLNIENELFNKIIFNTKRAMAVNIVLLLKKIKIKKAFREKSKTKLSWWDITKLVLKKSYIEDMILQYSASNPIKRNFKESPYWRQNNL